MEMCVCKKTCENVPSSFIHKAKTGKSQMPMYRRRDDNCGSSVMEGTRSPLTHAAQISLKGCPVEEGKHKAYRRWSHYMQISRTGQLTYSNKDQKTWLPAGGWLGVVTKELLGQWECFLSQPGCGLYKCSHQNILNCTLRSVHFTSWKLKLNKRKQKHPHWGG